MKACPYCGSTRYKSLCKGVPRCCLNSERARLDELDLSPSEREQELSNFIDSHLISTVRGRWYERAPIYWIMGEFIVLMQRPHQHGPDFVIHPSEHRILIPAIVTLLERCNGDRAIATEFVKVRFDSWFSHKRCNSFFQILAPHSFSTQLAEAKRKIEYREKARQLQELAIQSTEEETELDYVYAVVDGM